MKKVLMACIILFTILIQNAYSKTLNSKPLPTGDTTISLNGIGMDLAKKMKKRFCDIKKNDKRPTAVSVWFTKEQIHAIVALLDTEKIHQIPKTRTGVDSTDKSIGITDGIRIYFACDTSATTTHLNSKIILVSTMDNGISTDPTSVSKKRHLDYFEHSKNADLFKLTSLNGQVNYGKNSRGTLLYQAICPYCQNYKECQKLPNNIRIGNAREMVAKFGNHAINTTGEWFPLSVFESLDTANLHNGIRIYFATYPKVSKKETDKIKIGRSSRDAFVITTTKLHKNFNRDYFDCKKPKTPPVQPHGFLLLSNVSSAKDNGELCPNNCD